MGSPAAYDHSGLVEEVEDASQAAGSKSRSPSMAGSIVEMFQTPLEGVSEHDAADP